MANNFNIVLNSSNYNSKSRQFEYILNVPTRFEKKKVGLVQASIYKQWENIKSEYGNNTITVTWINDVVYTFTIPDGNYSVAQINEYLGYELYKNNLYLIDANNSTQASVNFEITTNSVLYGTQLTIYPIYNSVSSAAQGLTLPPNSTWNFPSVTKNPVIQFSSNFGKLIGFSAGSYGTGNTVISQNSTVTPQIAIVNNLLIQTNLINNHFINPPDVISSMTTDAEYGALLKYTSGQILYTNISPNNFSMITVYFSDQNLNKLTIKDTDVCIVLSIIDA